MSLTPNRSRRLLLGAPILMLFGCGSGSSTSPDNRQQGAGANTDTTGPSIGSSSVADGATDVSVTPTITLAFSENLDPATVNENTVSMTRASASAVSVRPVATPQVVDASVPVTVTVSGPDVTIAPRERLGFVTTYALAMSDEITDATGNRMAPYGLGFSTRDGIWSAGQAITNPAAGHAVNPLMTGDSDGGAAAVWIKFVDPRTLWFARLRDGVWGTPEAVQTNTDRRVQSPGIAGDGAGRYLVTWEEMAPDFSWHALARVFDANGGWGPVQLLSGTGLRPIQDIAAAMNASGQAIVAWTEQDGQGIWHINARRYAPGSGWSQPVQLESLAGNAGAPSVAIAPSGRSWVTWANDGNGERRAAVTWTTTGDQWATPLPLHAGHFGADEAYSSVVADAAGNAHVVWARSATGGPGLWTRRFDVVAATWSDPVAFADPDLYALGMTTAAIGVAPDGSALLVWSRSDLTPGNGLHQAATRYARYDPAAGWGPVSVVPVSPNGPELAVGVKVDPSGNAIAMVMETDFQTYANLRTQRYLAGRGWAATSQLVGATDPESGGGLVANADGTANLLYTGIEGNTAVIRWLRFE